MFLKYNIRCGISIHALREEGDISLTPDFTKCFYFNPRPPRGGRPGPLCGYGRQLVFQSTPSARRATKDVLDFLFSLVFQSTPSARRATERWYDRVADLVISIHALREEGDREQTPAEAGNNYFNPRPPRGGRRESRLRAGETLPFQSTPSARRATIDCRVVYVLVSISIHALREEGDAGSVGGASVGLDFNPRPPRGGRLTNMPSTLAEAQFQSTPSARRAT